MTRIFAAISLPTRQSVVSRNRKRWPAWSCFFAPTSHRSLSVRLLLSMAATPLIEVRAGPAFGTLTASPKASLAKPFCNWALDVGFMGRHGGRPPLVGPKSHSENHGRKSQLCSSSRNTGSDRRKENYETTIQPLQNHRRDRVADARHRL